MKPREEVTEGVHVVGQSEIGVARQVLGFQLGNGLLNFLLLRSLRAYWVESGFDLLDKSKLRQKNVLV
jgi:hypothetical protein